MCLASTYTIQIHIIAAIYIETKCHYLSGCQNVLCCCFNCEILICGGTASLNSSEKLSHFAFLKTINFAK